MPWGLEHRPQSRRGGPPSVGYTITDPNSFVSWTDTHFPSGDAANRICDPSAAVFSNPVPSSLNRRRTQTPDRRTVTSPGAPNTEYPR